MKTLGIVFSNIHDRELGELAAKRTLASVPFGGRYRLVDFPLSNMVNSGISKVGIITKYNYQSLMDHVGSGKHWDLSRKNGGLMILPPFGDESSHAVYTSRFEALKNISHFLRRSDENYVVMSDCDCVCNCDFAEIVQYHIDRHADITVVYREKDIEAGKTRTIIDMDVDNRVKSVTVSDKISGKKVNVYTNICVMNRQFLLNILENAGEYGYKSFSGDVLGKGCKNWRVYGFKHTGYFASIDSVANYYKHSLELLDKATRASLFDNNGANIYTKVRDSAPCRITDSALVTNSLIADGCIIEGTVINSILFRGVKVAKGAVVKDSIVFQESSIDGGSRLNCVIADKNVHILEGRELSGHATHPYYIAKNVII